MVTVIYGGNDAVVGSTRSIAELRAAFGPAFGIPETAKASLNNQDVYDEAGTFPQDGAKVVFSLPTGEKG